jgi:3D (Asp-Asp-Asp) domain-containing protein
MALHLGAKLSTIGIAIAILITGFSPTPQEVISVEIFPSLELLPTPMPVESYRTPGPTANPRYNVTATGYNSLPSQTDSTPHITSTGKRTSFGIIAVSRDLLGSVLPYGSIVRLRDLGNLSTGTGAGEYKDLFETQNFFIVEDTMHARKSQQVDIWFARYDTAISWGIRRVEIELVRFGREGPLFTETPSFYFDVSPLLNSR